MRPTFCYVIVISFIFGGLSFSKKNASRNDRKYWNVSTSFTKNDNKGHITSAAPTITITQQHIVITNRIEGGGIIKNTTLEGPAGRYELGPGDNNVNPGTYKQTTIGTVTVYTGGPASAIYSDVNYN
jgi:hypothetical protein